MVVPDRPGYGLSDPVDIGTQDYRKSAGLSLAAEVARLAIPHMLMPQPGSPENFMSMLGGVLPPNFADIPQQDRARLEKGNRYAAQRGLLRDELSGLFKSMGRDYMAGLKELIMTLYDCPPYLDSNTNNKGLVVIRDAALSILGAATTAELSTGTVFIGLVQRQSRPLRTAHTGTRL